LSFPSCLVCSVVTDPGIGIQQHCQRIFFKSARSDVKIRQNPPSRIGQIRQKSAGNWDDFRPFFTLRVVFVGFQCGFCLILEVAKEKYLSFLKIFCTKLLFFKYFFFAREREKKVVVLLIETKPPESARQKQNHTKLVKSARNPPEIRSPPEIFFARQTTFKSARIVQIWRRKPLSGNAGLCATKKQSFTAESVCWRKTDEAKSS
jgi:hypothetical protein